MSTPERIEIYYDEPLEGTPSIGAISVDALEAAGPDAAELTGFEAMQIMLEAGIEPVDPGGVTGEMDQVSMNPDADLVWATGDTIEVGDTPADDIRAPSMMFAHPEGRWIFTLVASTPAQRVQLVEAFCNAITIALRPPEQFPDASGAAPTGDAPPPDLEGATAGDDGAEPLPLGSITTPTTPDRLDFLFERGEEDDWPYRDAVFVNPDDPQLVTATWQAGRPFHVRHGFVNDGPEPLGPGFDVVLYITPDDSIPGGPPSGDTVRYSSDYVLRGETDHCGPTYRTQTGPMTCEWFVHEFHEGLPAGRYTLWAFWEAPCQAWIDYGYVAECTDPDEVLTLFTSGVNSPWTINDITWDQTWP